MALGALLNSMASLTSSLGTVGGLMTGLGGIAATVGSALSSAIGTAVQFAVEKFNDLKTFIDETLLPALGPLEPVVRGIGSVVKTILGGALEGIKILVESGIIPILKIVFDTFKAIGKFLTGDFSGAFDTIEGTVKNNLLPLLKSIMRLPGKILAAGIGLAAQGARAMVNKVKDVGKDIVGGVKSSFVKIKDAITKPFLDAFRKIRKKFEPVSKILGKVKKFGGGLKDKIKGAAGAINDARKGDFTSIGAAVQGGMNTSVNMTLSLAGMTDKSDKRMYANEIGSMIEDQVKARLGTARSVL
tara:strand:+ start:7197 stop:8099 length:903 start_codon:yes stop_codon:yes gene_type:complete